MTLRQAFEWLGNYSAWIGGALATFPVLAFVFGRLHSAGGGGRAPWKYLYSVLVYVSSFPGMCAAVVAGYMLFFEKENLLDVNAVVTLLPVVSMAATLILIRKNVSFDEVPGFDRISGLLTLIAVTFVFVLAIYKARIFLVFFGSIPMLIALVVGLFALLKWGTYMLFRKRDEPKVEAPKFPDLPAV